MGFLNDEYLEELSPDELGAIILRKLSKAFSIPAIIPDLKRLLKAGANLNYTNNNERSTALHWLAQTYATPSSIIELLIDGGADINAKTDVGGTPLHWAANMGKLNACRILLNSGADTSIVNIDGDTAWDLAPENIKRVLPELNPNFE